MFRDATFEASEQSLFSSAAALSAFARAAAGESVPEAAPGAKPTGPGGNEDGAQLDGKAARQQQREARCGVDAAGFRWARPTDPFPTAESKSAEDGGTGAPAPALADPGLFIDGDDAGDVVCQAAFLDDAWFLGALGAIAAHPLALVQNLFVEEDDTALLERGFVTCRFYVEGEWQEVKVDSRLPLREDSESGPSVPRVAAYGRCKNPEEQWVQLVEKAYAKLCGGNYACLDGGSVADALTDLTGGSSQTILFTTPQVADMIERSALWGRVQKYLEWFYVLACAKTAGVGTRDGPVSGTRDEHSGLLYDRAYSILTAKEVGALRFVKVRNPWGAGGDWQGDWSDESPKWDEHPEVEQAMKEDESIGFDRLNRDGTFWMVWEDFTRQFDTLHMCRLFGEEFNQYLIQGKWEGSSAGGAHKVVLAQEKGKGKKSNSSSSKEGKEDGAALAPTRPDARRGTYVQEDGDVRWFNNPQYRIEVTKETECYITLMQRDARLRNGSSSKSEGKTSLPSDDATSDRASSDRTHFFSDFTLLRQRRSDRRRLWEHVPDDVVCSGSDSHFANPAQPSREVAKASVRLSPKYAYVLVPHTKKWGIDLPYTVRIFTTGEMTVEALPELYARTFEGAWNIDPDSAITAGGPLRSKNSRATNPRWTQNPQYLVRLPKLPTSRPGVGAGTVSLKIVVSRTDKTNVNKGKREGSRNYAALAVVKPDPPHTDGKKRRAAITNFMGEPLSPSHKHKKKSAGEGKDGGGEGKEERAPLSYGKTTLVERKLAVTSSEWCVVSEGTDREVASILLPNVRQSWCENGLLIVPSLMRVDLMGSYVVRVYSDHPVQVEELPQVSSRTIPGAWTEQHSGGMHMNTDWKRNPKFTLELRPRGNGMNGGDEQLQDGGGQQQLPPQRVKITLRRPEDRWRKKCAKDNAVDCMMGFYVVAGTRVTKEPTGIYHQNVPWTMTGFVPIHEISTPDGFYLDVLPNEEVYTIVPVTYSPGITGPFFMTVEASCDFVLKGK